MGLKAVIYGYMGKWREAAEMAAQDKRLSGESNFTLAMQLGYDAEAMAAARRTTQLDPLNPRSWDYLQMICRIEGDTQCQLEGARRSHELAPDEPVPAGYLYYALAEAGEKDEARAFRGRYAQLLGPFSEINAPVDARYLAWMNGDGPGDSVADVVQAVRSGRGYVDPAVEMLDHMHAYGPAAQLLDSWGPNARPSLGYLYRRAAAPLRQTPQFWSLMEREGLTAYWRASGRWPDFCADPLLGYDCAVEAESALTALKVN